MKKRETVVSIERFMEITSSASIQGLSTSGLRCPLIRSDVGGRRGHKVCSAHKKIRLGVALRKKRRGEVEAGRALVKLVRDQFAVSNRSPSVRRSAVAATTHLKLHRELGEDVLEVRGQGDVPLPKDKGHVVHLALDPHEGAAQAAALPDVAPVMVQVVSAA